MPWTTRLVGRAAEMFELNRERRQAAAGQFRCVLILADAGIGKTRLAREFLARIRGETITLSARAYSLGETASFGVWSEALERHLRGLTTQEVTDLCGGFLDDLAALVRSVAAVRGTAPDREPPRLRLLEGLALLVANLASRLPVVAFLDDAHSADASSLEGLSYLGRNVPDQRVLVLAAARPAELTENETAMEVFHGLEQDGVLRRLELSPLDPDDLSDLALAVLDETPPPALVHWLVERSRGNPLFALGLLQALLDEGADLSSPELRSLPQDLVERVGARVKGLDEPGLATLEAMATLGRRVELRDLVGLTGLPIDRLPITLERLVRSRLVTEEERGRELTYEIAHPLIEEAIYGNIGGARRRGLHRLVGRALLAAGRLAEAASHYAGAAEVGDAEAIGALREAVRQAEERGAYREALTILDALVQLIPSGDKRWMDVVDALSWKAEWVVDHRADIHALLGIKAMRAIDSILERSPDPASRAAVKFRLANFLGWGTGDLDEAEVACAEACSLFEEAKDRSSALLAKNELAWIRGLRGDYPGMQAAAERVAEAADATGERFAAIQALHAKGFAAFVRGRFAEAEAPLRLSNAMAQQEGKVYRLTVGLNGLACSVATEGRVEEALPLLEEAKAVNPAWRDSILPEWETIVHWFGGDFPAALGCAAEAAARAVGELSKRRAIGVVFASLAAAEAARAEEAHSHLERARRAFGGRDWQFFSHALGHAEGVLAWQEGRPADAQGILEETAARILATDALPFGALALLDLAEVASEREQLEVVAEAAGRLDEIAQRIDRDLYGALAAMGLAATGDADAARQAVDFLSVSSCKAFHARALDLLGRSLLETDRPAAVDALKGATVAHEGCGAVWRGDRARALLRSLGGRARRAASASLGPAALSRRERQVARVAAEGQTAREIAERLFISERTVETHLANVYAKLGVRSKTELVRRASELGLNQ
ncbi:MAG TPA: LuxR C-terminal-related transcriptional regulator [Actinomycetota bacterium]|nr:LuxR C-terminal-related transcriptional regulator [Actinomycetota bacterium]